MVPVANDGVTVAVAVTDCPSVAVIGLIVVVEDTWFTTIVCDAEKEYPQVLPPWLPPAKKAR